MATLTKNIARCKKRVVLHPPRRRVNSGTSNVVDSTKMQAKSIVISQLKLINELKCYFSKLTTDKSFENALNQQFIQFLQKIDPKIYGKDLSRFFASSQAAVIPKKSNTPEQAKSRNAAVVGNLPGILSGLMINVGSRAEPIKETIPHWKRAKALVSREAIASRTSQVLSSLIAVESDNAKLNRVEELVTHLKQYPEAKHCAVKEGAIRHLLRIRQKSKNMELKCALNEAFALLGHAEPVSGSGIRILSIDGGGTRGILVIEMLKKLEELSGRPVYEMFDLICGVSTGAIIATLLGLKQVSLDEIAEIYKDISTQIFTQSTLKGTSSLVWSHSYYDTALWEKLLQEQWGDKVLIETTRNLTVPKFCAISAVVNQERLSAYVFRNYALPCKVQSQYMGGYNHKVWESVRATAAAPTYFEEFKIGNMLHQDGGILVNNPTAVAIHEAKLLWPTMPIQSVVSFGTGRTAPNPTDYSNQGPTAAQISNSSWKKKFFAIIDSATDTEGVHTMLSDLLPGNVYYRFNPYLTEMLDIAEIDPNKLEQLKRDALMYLRRNEDKFHDAVYALNKKKNLSQKLVDWLNLKKTIHGINQG